jgi:CRISPR-associated protein Cas1
METLFVAKDATLSREGATLLVSRPDRPKARVPIAGLRHVVLAGEAGLTSALLGLFGRSGVRVTVLDWYGNFAGAFEPRGAPSAGRVRLAQARHASDPVLRRGLARSIVGGALANLLAILRYRAYRGVKGVKPAIGAIEALSAKVPLAADVAALMGLEGSARAWYYEAWGAIDVRLAFGPRVRRPPNNRVNCLISWFNGLAYAAVRNEIAKTHLDDCISFLHAPTAARHSLALDLAEVFKPALCDALIMELVLRDRPADAWFHEEEPGVCRLTEAGRVATLEEWTRRLDGRTDAETPSMRDLIRAEALAIERHVLGIADYVPWRRRV